MEWVPHWDEEVNQAELPSGQGQWDNQDYTRDWGGFICTEVFWSFWEAGWKRLRPLVLSKCLAAGGKCWEGALTRW